MHFDDLVERLPLDRLDTSELPARDDVRRAVALVGEAIRDHDFVLDAIEQRLAAAIEHPTDRAPPIWSRDHLEIWLCVWPPHEIMAAHEHRRWTVTAMLHHALSLRTFDLEAAARGVLQPRSEFTVAAGQSGHIYDHAIHEVWNPTDRFAASLHLVSAGDPTRTAADLGLVATTDAPDSRTVAFTQRRSRSDLVSDVAGYEAVVSTLGERPVAGQTTLRGLFELLASSAAPRSTTLLERGFAIADLANRRYIVDALGLRTPARELRARVDAAAAVAAARLADRDWVRMIELGLGEDRP